MSVVSESVAGLRRRTYILMTCICEDNDGETTQRRNQATPTNHTNLASIRHGVALEEVRQYENDEITNGDEGDHARVLERIETS